jgi:group I intron endonuclease
MSYGIIYIAKNLTNGKVYVGKTTQTIEKRKWEHNNRAKLGWEQLIYKAIRKYGSNSFQWSVIEHCDNEESINNREEFWIKHYNSYIGEPNSNGYNMTTGGEGTSGHKLSEETKRKMSESKTGERNPMYGKKVSEETIKKTVKYGSDNGMSKAVIQLTMDGLFVAEHETVVEASNSVDGDKSTIVKCCKGTRKSHKGYRWSYKDGDI